MSVVFPRHVGPVLLMRLQSWGANTRRWCLEALANVEVTDTVRTERRRLAGDIARSIC